MWIHALHFWITARHQTTQLTHTEQTSLVDLMGPGQPKTDTRAGLSSLEVKIGLWKMGSVGNVQQWSKRSDCWGLIEGEHPCLRWGPWTGERPVFVSTPHHLYLKVTTIFIAHAHLSSTKSQSSTVIFNQICDVASSGWRHLWQRRSWATGWHWREGGSLSK